MKLGIVADPGLAWRLILQLPDAQMLCKLMQCNSVFYTFILRNQLLIAAVEQDKRTCSKCNRKLGCCWCGLLYGCRVPKRSYEIETCLMKNKIDIIYAYDAVLRDSWSERYYLRDNYW